MKLFSTALATAILAASMAVGCTESPSRFSDNRAGIELTPKTSMTVGESKWVNAKTYNLAGAKGIQWSVTPNGGKLTPDKNRSNQSALFTADQAGTYIVTASADLGNGQTVTSDTTITVNGRTEASERDMH